VDVVNVLTGNLDRPGGAMFTTPATGGSNTAGTSGKGKGARFGRRRTRVRGLAEHFNEFPVAVLAEEILTPGDGRVRAVRLRGGDGNGELLVLLGAACYRRLTASSKPRG